MVSLSSLSDVQSDDRTRFCIEMSSDRTQQTATEQLFQAVSQHAAEVPIIVVATKMDQFRGIKREEARESYEGDIPDLLEFDKKCKAHVVEQIRERMELIEKEMRQVEGGRFDACVDVARSWSCPFRCLNSSADKDR